MLQIFSQRLLMLADLTFCLLALDYLISDDMFVRVMIDEFVDQHNMVACLERRKENAEFHQIVDFLTTSSIHYALTQIHAIVDGKTVVISESSVRTLFSPQWKYLIHTILHCLSSKSTSWNEFSTNIASAVICLATSQKFNFSKLIFDEPFNDTYETPKHTKKVFTNMKRKGKHFSGRVTPLFASMLAPPVVRGEGSGQPSKPQPPSSTTQPIIEEQIPTSVPIPNVADEAVFKEREDRVVPRSHGGAIAQTRSERASKHSYEPLPSVNTPRSDEERNEQQDLMDFKPPTPHDSPLLGGHTPGSDKVKRLKKALRARTQGMKLFMIGTSRRKGLDKENVSKQGRKSDKTKPMFKDSDFDVLDDVMENVEGGSTAKQITTIGDTLNTASINVSAVGPSTSTTVDIFEDEMTTIADTLVAIRSARPRITSVVIRNVEEEPRRATPVPTIQRQYKGKGKIVEPKPTPKNPRKTQIQMDEELAQSDDSGKKDDSSSKQAESSKKRPRAEHDEESVKKQKLQDDAEKEELRACLDIVQGDDIAIDVESLATKYPIVD
ncbi:hypothetical protein Tco_1045170 [Tanacetum coccineum]|uniref:Uncharacterized protein n=1 Tax=Tanacetum coccineum TaxID=301880 RepID=A0ABQ5GSV9_9ASTR